MPPKASKRKAANGYKLPEPIPNGTIITGTNKKQFRIGKSIGTGGFGEIYLASEDTSRPVGDDAVLALKIEPHENGPLFVEMNFYIRAAQSAMVEEFKKERGLKSFGMPCLRGNGSHVHNKEKYRFLIMDRYGKDLQKIFQTGKKCFSNRVTYNLALKIIDVLEYIHSKGYVHNDIKAQNLLLGYGRTKENDIYLVDFGLVSKYHKEGVHHEYKPDLRKAHDGTIEYTSRDAHIGAHSRRSDLEILAYNLVHWMSGDLPWMDNLTNPKYVQSQKNGYMNDVKAFLQRCFKSDDYPDVLEEFLNYVVAMDFDTEPDYDKCRAMFQKALKKAKFPLDGKIDFATPKNAPKKARRRKKSDYEDIDFSEETSSARKSMRNIKNSSDNGRVAPNPTPAASPTPEEEKMNEWSWEKILCSDPEMLIRQASRQSETEDDSPLALQRRALDEKRQRESLVNPTDAMKEIMAKIEEREREREQMTWQQQLQHFKKSMQRSNSESDGLQSPNPLTPAMEEVIRMRQKRISVEIDIPITPEPSDSENSDEDFVIQEVFKPKPPPAKKIKKSTKSQRSKSRPNYEENDDPFEFNDDEREEVGVYKSPSKSGSCLNVVDTGSCKRRLSSTPEYEKPAKKRRISIQNEATPIRNKESPQEEQPKPKPVKQAKSGRGRKKTLTPKRLSSIPEDVFIESIQNVAEAATPPPAATKKRGRKPAASVVTPTEKAKPEFVKPVRRAASVRQNMRSSDAKMRTTRAQDWKWENILVSNPEKILRKTNK